MLIYVTATCVILLRKDGGRDDDALVGVAKKHVTCGVGPAFAADEETGDETLATD